MPQGGGGGTNIIIMIAILYLTMINTVGLYSLHRSYICMYHHRLYCRTIYSMYRGPTNNKGIQDEAEIAF